MLYTSVKNITCNLSEKDKFMLVAIPLDTDFCIYHGNPSTAPHYALYTIEGERSDLRFKLSRTAPNPWVKNGCDHANDEAVRNCACPAERAEDMHHIADHYVILEAIKGCEYLLAGTFCRNTVKTLRNGGIKTYKIPPFIHNSDKAIKHFLIGENYADTVQHIHHAS